MGNNKAYNALALHSFLVIFLLIISLEPSKLSEAGRAVGLFVTQRN